MVPRSFESDASRCIYPSTANARYRRKNSMSENHSRSIPFNIGSNQLKPMQNRRCMVSMLPPLIFHYVSPKHS